MLLGAKLEINEEHRNLSLQYSGSPIQQDHCAMPAFFAISRAPFYRLNSLYLQAMSFKDYLQSKKIDPKGFALNQPDQFRAFKLLFDQMHPESFTAQKLFLINKLRRQYPFTETESVKTDMPEGKMMRPKLNITPKKDL